METGEGKGIRAEPMSSQTKTLWMEQCQIAYLKALASQACCSMAKPEPDVHKLDWHLTHEQAFVPVGVQLKSMHQATLGNGPIKFSLDRATHEVLRRVDAYRRFLFVLVLPADGEWVVSEPTHLCLRWCMYWLDVRGEPQLTADSKTYSIASHQRVTSEWLCSVFNEITEEVGD